VATAPAAQLGAAKTPGGELSEVVALRQAMLEMQQRHDAQVAGQEARLAALTTLLDQQIAR
jgi:hypothetical protein